MLTIFENIKHIALEIDKAIKREELGYNDRCNATGDNQLKLDVACDAIIEYSFSQNSLVKVLISEEKEDELLVNPNGKYTICYDPLDGSSIVDVNLSVGSIFGIYEGEPTSKNLLASAYLVFGSRIEMVVATKNGSTKHYRSGDSGLFSSECDIYLNDKGNINAPGGTQKDWLKVHKDFINSLFMDGYRLRYSGGMVPDLHHILLKGGGIFSYPATIDKPKGKLRALFEVFPFALIFERAGGKAIDDKGIRLLDIDVKHHHDTLPCFFGSKEEISRLKKAYGV